MSKEQNAGSIIGSRMLRFSVGDGFEVQIPGCTFFLPRASSMMNRVGRTVGWHWRSENSPGHRHEPSGSLQNVT